MSKKYTIRHERRYETLRIFINNLIHIQLKLREMVGFQSWIHGENEFFIEYYYESGTKITSAYGNRKIWEDILKILDKCKLG